MLQWNMKNFTCSANTWSHVMAKSTVPCPQEGLLCIWLQAAISTVHILFYSFISCQNSKNETKYITQHCFGLSWNDALGVCSLNFSYWALWLPAVPFGQKSCLWLSAGMCAVIIIFCVPQVPHKCLAKQVLSWKCKQANACFCRCIEPLQEGIIRFCTNMKRGIIIKGEAFLLARLDKSMEVVQREPGEHFLSVICGALGGTWQCGTWLLPTLAHLGHSFLPLWVWPVQTTSGCSAGSKWLLRCSTEPVVTKVVSLHWPPQPHLCWDDPADTENSSPNTLGLKNSYTHDKSKSSHFYNYRWMED